MLLAELIRTTFYTQASRAVKQSELLSREIWYSWNKLHKGALLHDPESKIHFGIICRAEVRPKSDMLSSIRRVYLLPDKYPMVCSSSTHLEPQYCLTAKDRTFNRPAEQFPEKYDAVKLSACSRADRSHLQFPR